MSDFDLNNFLKNYKPKKLNLEPYLNTDKLKDYSFLTKTKKYKLMPQKTYIKYILASDAFSDNNYINHIHPGGIFMKGGFFVNGEFTNTDDYQKWTHLMLKYVPYPKYKQTSRGMVKDTTYSTRIYYIALINYYVFYKYFY